MKNIQYNSNLQTHRIQLRVSPLATLRVTVQWMVFRADQRNNMGGNIATFSDRDLGHETLLVLENFVSSQVYLRGSFSMLFPSSGVTEAVPGSDSKPWYTVIAQANLSY